MENASTERQLRPARYDPTRLFAALAAAVVIIFRRNVKLALLVVASLLFIGIPLVIVFQEAFVRSATDTRMERLAEPPLAAAYLEAYARADILAADDLASPLNDWEWTRRGLDIDAQERLLPKTPGSRNSDAWIHYDYIGGIRDAVGFGHLLYLARPTAADESGFPSVWRVDIDPSGRVIWAELVYLFASVTVKLEPIPNTDRMFLSRLPPEIARLHPLLVAGAHAPDGLEAYYMLTVPAPPAAGRSAPRDSLVFIGVDEEGTVHPGVWSYGREDLALLPYGQTPARRPMTPDSSLIELLAGYSVANY